MSEAVVAGAVPDLPSLLSPRGWRDLLVRPTAFFASAKLTKRPELTLAAWIVGVAMVMEQLDARLAAAGAGVRISGTWLALAHAPWAVFWIGALLLGTIQGAIVWYVGGWWYRVRLELSGAIDPDPRRARAVYTYQNLVQDVPAIIATVLYSLFFSSYFEASQSDEMWSLLVLPFVLWSCVTSYFGATTAFTISRVKAAIWFVVVPLVAYTMLLIGSAIAFALVGGQ